MNDEELSKKLEEDHRNNLRMKSMAEENLKAMAQDEALARMNQQKEIEKRFLHTNTQKMSKKIVELEDENMKNVIAIKELQAEIENIYELLEKKEEDIQEKKEEIKHKGKTIKFVFK